MKRETCSTLEHLAGVAAVIGLSVVIHLGVHTGAGVLGPTPMAGNLLNGPDPHIAAPASDVWGHAVLRLNGMN